MKGYCLTESAKNQLFEILEYSVIKFGNIVAEKYLEGIENCFAIITANPKIGRFHNSPSSQIRRHEHKSHVIFYKIIENDSILIGAILHKSKLPKLTF